MILRLIKFSNLSSRRGGEEYTEYGPFSFLDAEDEEEEKVWRIWNVLYKYLNGTKSGERVTHSVSRGK